MDQATGSPSPRLCGNCHPRWHGRQQAVHAVHTCQVGTDQRQRLQRHQCLGQQTSRKVWSQPAVQPNCHPNEYRHLDRYTRRIIRFYLIFDDMLSS